MAEETVSLDPALAGPFLPHNDAAFSPGSVDLNSVVAVKPSATAATLLHVAQARLRRQVNLLGELAMLPTTSGLELEPFASHLFPALQEVANLLEAVSVRLRSAERTA